MRTRRNKKIAGVCAGLSRHLGIDVALIRIIMVCAAFWGFGVALYALCWLVMPMEPAVPMASPFQRPPRPATARA